MTTQDYLYNNDIGVRGIEATFDYSEDISAYTFTIQYTNLKTADTGEWIATGTWAAEVATVRYIPDEALDAGRYKFTIEVKSGTNEFNVGPYYFVVNEV